MKKIKKNEQKIQKIEIKINSDSPVIITNIKLFTISAQHNTVAKQQDYKYESEADLPYLVIYLGFYLMYSRSLENNRADNFDITRRRHCFLFHCFEQLFVEQWDHLMTF